MARRFNSEVKARKTSSRGLYLMDALVNSQGSPKEKCGECGCRIRGENHEQGTHHLQRVKSRMDK